MNRTMVFAGLLAGAVVLGGCAKKVDVDGTPTATAGQGTAEVSVTDTDTQTGQGSGTQGSGIQMDEREKHAFFSPVLGKVYLDGSQMYSIHFDFDESDLRSDARRILDNNVQYLNTHSGVDVIVEGHCDERGTNDYNIALGDRRAKAVRDYLVTSGIDPDRLSTVSYGEEKPVDKSSTEWAWTKNRRAEFTSK